MLFVIIVDRMDWLKGVRKFMRKQTVTRRGFVIGLAAFPLSANHSWAQSALPKMIVSKDPGCGCCGEWIAYLRAAGFSVEAIDSKDVDSLKARLGVPSDLASCHTAEIGGYVIEGHVPHMAIRRLLSERPKATGLAVPGMPPSSPGMDVPGARDIYDVILFGPFGRRRYARFQGRRELSI
jgi:hypothetical protein